MTDKEAFELLKSYCSEETMLSMKNIIHTVGVEDCVKTVMDVYKSNNMGRGDWEIFIRQAFNYI